MDSEVIRAIINICEAKGISYCVVDENVYTWNCNFNQWMLSTF